jgi:ribosome-binding protein aMBF1 (putative translation factor)
VIAKRKAAMPTPRRITKSHVTRVSKAGRIAFGQQVRLARERLGWSQTVLAKAVGTDQPYISAIERGLPNSTIDGMAKIAAALGVELQVLLTLPQG